MALHSPITTFIIASESEEKQGREICPVFMFGGVFVQDKIREFKKLSKKERYAHIMVWVLIALFLVFLVVFNKGVKRAPLLDENGNQFERATVTEIVSETRADNGEQLGDQELKVKMKTGEFKDRIVDATNINSYLYGAECKVGTNVIVQVSSYDGNVSASVFNYDRTGALLGMAAVFLISLVLIGKRKGLTSALGLIFTLICIVFLYLPMMYLGASPFLSAVIVTVLTTFVTMYLIGGFSKKTYCAILGTVGGVVVAGLAASLFGKIGHITGYNVQDIETLMYIGQYTPLNIGGLMFSGILIASLGAVMDVAMSISTSIEELHFHDPGMTKKELFNSGIKIGGDMMGTMSNTLILAFTGGSLTTLMIFYSYSMPFLQMFNSYEMGIEILQGLAGSLGVILTVPLVSLIAAVMMGKSEK